MAVAMDSQKQRLEGMIVVHLSPVIEMDDDQFFEFAQLNRDLRMERNSKGELIIMPPTGWETGDRNSEIGMQLRAWAKRNGQGRVADSSTGYILPNKATRSPDASWVSNERLESVSPQQRKKFLPVCPEFVVELKSPTDLLDEVQDKMQEWIANGAQLGWLIDPDAKRVYIYRPNEQVEILENRKSISGEPLLKGFTLDLTQIW
jgi:Uma2 family endonuclease